jgi:hypothetical protein
MSKLNNIDEKKKKLRIPTEWSNMKRGLSNTGYEDDEGDDLIVHKPKKIKNIEGDSSIKNQSKKRKKDDEIDESKYKKKQQKSTETQKINNNNNILPPHSVLDACENIIYAICKSKSSSPKSGTEKEMMSKKKRRFLGDDDNEYEKMEVNNISSGSNSPSSSSSSSSSRKYRDYDHSTTINIDSVLSRVPYKVIILFSLSN